MTTKFVPVTLDLIDEGNFLEGVNAELAKIQKEIIAFVKEHGDQAHKAKASMKIGIELQVQNVADNAYSIKGGIESKLPGRPSTVSLAMGGEDDANQPSLFVRASGSDSSEPSQLKLSTQDGRTVDPSSQQVIDED